MPQNIYDVIIVGGGPGGLSCAIYTARAKLSTVILDRAPTAGSLAYAPKIANYPGLEANMPGADLLEIMRAQAIAFGADYRKTGVVAVDAGSQNKVAYVPDDAYTGRAMVISTGSRGRRDKIEGEEEFLGRGVSYCATCDAAFYSGAVVGVVGYDEVAMEEALFLARFAREVHIISPKSTLVGPVDMLDEISASPVVTVHSGLQAVKVLGDVTVTGLVARARDDSESVISANGLFMLLSGNAPITEFLAGQVKLNPAGCIEVDSNCATNVSGVYAVGDVTCIHPNQAIIAAAEGVIAALSIEKYFMGRERPKVDYM